jgi:inward rectifier potassium channel
MHPFRRISKNPRSNIVRLGNREIITQGLNSGFWTDLYHRSMSVSWPVFFASAALVFIALNGTFALVFLLGDEPIANVPTGNFMDLFYFSIETLLLPRRHCLATSIRGHHDRYGGREIVYRLRRVP